MISRPTAFATAMSLPVEAEPDVGPLRTARPPRVDRIQPSTVVDALEEVVEEDRMRLSGIAPPEEDQIGLLGLTV